MLRVSNQNWNGVISWRKNRLQQDSNPEPLSHEAAEIKYHQESHNLSVTKRATGFEH